MNSTSVEELKTVYSKSSWVVELAGIECEAVSKNLTVEIPLLGEYLPSNLEYVDKIRQEILDLFINNKYPVTEKGIKGLEMWAHTAAIASNECAPSFQSDKPEKEGLIWFSLGWWMLDDLFDKLVQEKEILDARKNLNIFMDIFRDVWTGQFSTVDNIMIDKRVKNSESIHYLLPSFIAFQEAQKLLTICTPGFQNKLKYFFQEFQRWLESNHFLFQNKLKYGNNPSLEIFRAVRPRECGVLVWMELLYVVAHLDLTAEIRNHFLYAVFHDMGAISTAIMNDLYSIRRDLDDEHNHNHILILAKMKNISLEVAINMTINHVQDLISGVEKVGNQFIEEFRNDPVVTKVYDLVRNCFNGNITFPNWIERYGRVPGKLVRKA